MMKYVLGLLVALLPGLAFGQAANVNPAVGSVWTYMGPTYGAAWNAVGVFGPTVPTGIGTLVCFNSAGGNLVKECGTAAAPLSTRTYWSNTISGDQGPTLVGGVEIATTTTAASSQTAIGKISGLYVNNIFGPGAAEGQRAGIFAKVTQNGATSYTNLGYQYNTGVWSWVTVNQGNTTVGQEANYMGFGGLVEIGGTTRANNIVGMEIDVNVGATASVGNRIGILAAIGAGTFGAQTRATFFDGAFAVARAAAAEATFKTGYALRGPDGVWPYGTDSNLIGGIGGNNGYGGVSPVAGNGIDFTDIAFTYAQYVSDTYFIDPGGRTFQFTTFPFNKMRDTAVGVTAGGLTRWMSNGLGSWCDQINTAASGDFTTAINARCMNNTGLTLFSQLAVVQGSPSSNALCNVGQIVADANYLYTCAASGAWKRVAVTGGY